MKRKHRISLRNQRLEERANNTTSGRRKRKYAQMAEEGILGNREAKTYASMYEEIYKKVPGFNLPSVGGEKSPTKREYREMKVLYNKYTVSL